MALVQHTVVQKLYIRASTYAGFRAETDFHNLISEIYKFRGFAMMMMYVQDNMAMAWWSGVPA